MAESTEIFTTQEPVEYTEAAHGGDAAHAEPTLLGLQPFQWVSVAMLLLILVAILRLKAHKSITAGLDGRIAAITPGVARAMRSARESPASVSVVRSTGGSR